MSCKPTTELLLYKVKLFMLGPASIWSLQVVSATRSPVTFSSLRRKHLPASHDAEECKQKKPEYIEHVEQFLIAQNDCVCFFFVLYS